MCRKKQKKSQARLFVMNIPINTGEQPGFADALPAKHVLSFMRVAKGIIARQEKLPVGARAVQNVIRASDITIGTQYFIF